MRYFIALMLVTSFHCHSTAQSSFDDHIKEGIAFHDGGNYDKAIDSYKKALKIDPKSAIGNYEIAYSYMALKEYKKSIKYANSVIDINGDYLIPAYMLKGSALDNMGKTDESIKVFEYAIKKSNGHYLLHYNLALSYYKKGMGKEAEENAIKAIENNSAHASSHFLLADLYNNQGKQVQSLLAAHYFLFLEPNTNRSQLAFNIINANFVNKGTAQDSVATFNINVSASGDEQLDAATLTLGLLSVSGSLEENKNKTEAEMFVENTKSFFTIMGELKKPKNKEIWWAFYTPFFYNITLSDHMETYCFYITQYVDQNSMKWLKDNEIAVLGFDTWLKNH